MLAVSNRRLCRMSGYIGTLQDGGWVTKILLVRHGHVEGINPERFRGRADVPLTDRGAAEAKAVAQHIASSWRPRKVYTSPMKRCVDTGGAIAQACHVDTEAVTDLNDIDYGLWQWRTYEEVQQTEPLLFSIWFATPQFVRFPKGESLQELVARGANVLRLVVMHHSDDTIVLVGHDSINRAMLLQLLDQPLSAYWRLAQAPCCINEIDIAERRVRVVRVNETGHLAGIAGD
jgi:phosphoserine phosphatase